MASFPPTDPAELSVKEKREKFSSIIEEEHMNVAVRQQMIAQLHERAAQKRAAHTVGNSPRPYTPSGRGVSASGARPKAGHVRLHDTDSEEDEYYGGLTRTLQFSPPGDGGAAGSIYPPASLPHHRHISVPALATAATQTDPSPGVMSAALPFPDPNAGSLHSRAPPSNTTGASTPGSIPGSVPGSLHSYPHSLPSARPPSSTQHQAYPSGLYQGAAAGPAAPPSDASASLSGPLEQQLQYQQDLTAAYARQAKSVEALLQAYIADQRTAAPDKRLQEVLLALQRDPKFSLPYAQYRNMRNTPLSVASELGTIITSTGREQHVSGVTSSNGLVSLRCAGPQPLPGGPAGSSPAATSTAQHTPPLSGGGAAYRAAAAAAAANGGVGAIAAAAGAGSGPSTPLASGAREGLGEGEEDGEQGQMVQPEVPSANGAAAGVEAAQQPGSSGAAVDGVAQATPGNAAGAGSGSAEEQAQEQAAGTSGGSAALGGRGHGHGTPASGMAADADDGDRGSSPMAGHADGPGSSPPDAAPHASQEELLEELGRWRTACQEEQEAAAALQQEVADLRQQRTQLLADRALLQYKHNGVLMDLVATRMSVQRQADELEAAASACRQLEAQRQGLLAWLAAMSGDPTATCSDARSWLPPSSHKRRQEREQRRQAVSSSAGQGKAMRGGRGSVEAAAAAAQPEARRHDADGACDSEPAEARQQEQRRVVQVHIEVLSFGALPWAEDDGNQDEERQQQQALAGDEPPGGQQQQQRLVRLVLLPTETPPMSPRTGGSVAVSPPGQAWRGAGSSRAPACRAPSAAHAARRLDLGEGREQQQQGLLSPARSPGSAAEQRLEQRWSALCREHAALQLRHTRLVGQVGALADAVEGLMAADARAGGAACSQAEAVQELLQLTQRLLQAETSPRSGSATPAALEALQEALGCGAGMTAPESQAACSAPAVPVSQLQAHMAALLEAVDGLAAADACAAQACGAQAEAAEQLLQLSREREQQQRQQTLAVAASGAAASARSVQLQLQVAALVEAVEALAGADARTVQAYGGQAQALQELLQPAQQPAAEAAERHHHHQLAGRPQQCGARDSAAAGDAAAGAAAGAASWPGHATADGQGPEVAALASAVQELAAADERAAHASAAQAQTTDQLLHLTQQLLHAAAAGGAAGTQQGSKAHGRSSSDGGGAAASALRIEPTLALAARSCSEACTFASAVAAAAAAFEEVGNSGFYGNCRSRASSRGSGRSNGSGVATPSAVPDPQAQYAGSIAGAGVGSVGRLSELEHGGTTGGTTGGYCASSTYSGQDSPRHAHGAGSEVGDEIVTANHAEADLAGHAQPYHPHPHTHRHTRSHSHPHLLAHAHGEEGVECGGRAGGHMDLDQADGAYEGGAFGELEEIAAAASAAGCCGPGSEALLDAVGFLKQQLELAHLEIVDLNARLSSLSHQQAGLEGRVQAKDVALQEIALAEGEAHLELSRLRQQLAAEGAARARAMQQCEELQKRLLSGLPERPATSTMLRTSLTSGTMPRGASPWPHNVPQPSPAAAGAGRPLTARHAVHHNHGDSHRHSSVPPRRPQPHAAAGSAPSAYTPTRTSPSRSGGAAPARSPTRTERRSGATRGSPARTTP